MDVVSSPANKLRETDFDILQDEIRLRFRFGHRIFAMLINAGARAVFTDADAVRGITCVRLGQSTSKVIHALAIPARIFIERIHLGIPVRWLIIRAGHSARAGACRILRGGKFRKLADQIRHLRAFLQSDFVEDAPANHGGMIVILSDQFNELLLRVGIKSRRFRDAINERNLRPENDCRSGRRVDKSGQRFGNAKAAAPSRRFP